MNPATRARIKGFLQSIADGTFGQDNIRLLLADLRPYLQNALLRDVADYVGHPEGRTRGLSHKQIDLNRWKLRRVANEEGLPQLSPMNHELMDLWIFGLNRMPPKFASEYLKTSPGSARKFIEAAYYRFGDHYELRADLTVDQMAGIQQVFKVVFNAVHMQPLFPQKVVIHELSSVISRLSVPNAKAGAAAMRSNQTEVMLCLMCALQHVPVEFADGEAAALEWGLDAGNKLSLYAVFQIPYQGTGLLTIRFFHATSDARADDYLSMPLGPAAVLHTQRRSDGKLELVQT